MTIGRWFSAASVAGILACSSSSDSSGPDGNPGGNNPPACTPSATKICMVNSTFDPTTLTVAKGTTVTWENGDGLSHTVTANPSNPAGCPTFDNNVAANASAPAVTFNPSASATCQFYCRIHATPTTGAMRGSIVVQ